MSSEKDKLFLRRAAELQEGVREVVDEVAVKPSAALAGSSSPVALSVRQRLLTLPSPRRFSVNVYEHDGIVTLTGIASSAEEARALAQLAAGTAGVIEVRDQISAPAPLTDAALDSRIREALTDHRVPSTLHWRVNNGVITLYGDAANHREIDQVLSTMLMVDGVKNVHSTAVVRAR